MSHVLISSRATLYRAPTEPSSVFRQASSQELPIVGGWLGLPFRLRMAPLASLFFVPNFSTQRSLLCLNINTVDHLLAIAATSIVCFACIATTRADGPYHFLKEIPVGGEGGWDYLSMDQAARRLYVSHGTKVVVIDIDKEEVMGEIADTPGVHGIALATDLQRAFTSNGQESKASIVDVKPLKTLSKVDTDKNPDAILYDPGQQEVYTFNGRGKSATVFDTKTGMSSPTSHCRADPSSPRSIRKPAASTTTSKTRASSSPSIPRPTRSSTRGPSPPAKKRPAWRLTPPTTDCSPAATTN